MKRLDTPRDVLLLQGQGLCLVTAVDSCGGIGPKAQDALDVPLDVVGRFTARTVLLEVLATGAVPAFAAISVCNEPETAEELLRGIRPALGYPASPDHSEKRDLFELLEATKAGLDLTESYAMTPAAAVSGLIFAHPSSRYFTVGRLGRDQIEDYARRRGLDIAEVERWLRPNLAYDPDES